MTNQTYDSIKHDIDNNDIVLYMKGNADFPKCGFSSLVVAILKKINLEFKAIDVLEDEKLRRRYQQRHRGGYQKGKKKR